MKSNEMVKEGYKQTEIGVLPEDWEVKQLRDFACVRGGKRLPAGQKLVDTRTSHPYIRVTDMVQGGVNTNDIKYVPADVFPAIKNYRIYSEDIFISVAGTLGIVGKVPPILNGANLTENADCITDISCHQDYLLYCLMSDRIQNTISAIRTIGAQPKLALGRIEKFTFPVPPLPEQRAIAAVLSDVDALISSLDRLIAKKRDIKQATMQQLLTGQTRLPGFDGEWEVKRLGDIVSIRNQKVWPQRIDPETPYIELEHIQKDAGLLMGLSVANESASTKYTFKSGDILFGRLRSYLRKYWLADFDGICTTEIWPFIVNPSYACNKFIYAIVQMTAFIETAGISYGTHMPRADWNIVKNYEFQCPPLPEQTAIATILSDMDAEIEALQARRDKTRQLKQGMMQELLTGKTRLKWRPSDKASESPRTVSTNSSSTGSVMSASEI